MVMVVYLLMMVVFMYCNHLLRQGQLRRKRRRIQRREHAPSALLTRQILADNEKQGALSLERLQRARVFHRSQHPLDVRFERLGLRVGDGDGRRLLRDVSGHFKSNRMACIMGPSGCGKTTLLNALCGRAATYGGTTEGRMFVNGVAYSMATVAAVTASMTGFVTQDDSVHGDLTVLENLAYSCHLRAPAHYTPARRKALVDGLCEMLGLGDVQDCVVGTVQRRGISGGQKKRVNVGVELAADPTVLLLDEPTSGLASTDTLCLVQCLSSFAHRKRTVVAVIHQPRHTVRGPVSWWDQHKKSAQRRRAAIMLCSYCTCVVEGRGRLVASEGYRLGDHFRAEPAALDGRRSSCSTM